MSKPTGQGLVVGAYNGHRPCAQILQRKINKAAGRERRESMRKPSASAGVSHGRAKATGGV